MSAADPIVKQETRFIAVWEIIFSVILQAVFLVCGWWDYTVLLGNIFAGTVAVVNFYLMGITVVKTLEKEKDDEKEARSFAKASQTGRFMMLFIVAAFGLSLPCFNTYSTLIPLLFPRVSAWLRMLIVKKTDVPAEDTAEGERTERGEDDQ